MEIDENGNKAAIYAYGPSIDEPISIVRNESSYYYHADHLGSIKILTDENENVVATYQYDAFGTILQEIGSINNPYRFTGREWDAESGLYYYRARYYDAVFGRFLQKDPAGVEEGNLYTYVKNNPINYKDPSGAYISSNGLICAASVLAFVAFQIHISGAWEMAEGASYNWVHCWTACEIFQRCNNYGIRTIDAFLMVSLKEIYEQIEFTIGVIWGNDYLIEASDWGWDWNDIWANWRGAIECGPQGHWETRRFLWWSWRSWVRRDCGECCSQWYERP